MRYLALVALLGFVMAFAVGCKSETPPPTPTPPKDMGKAMDDANKALKEGTEKATDAMKEGVEKADKALDEATKKVEETTEK